MALAYTAPTWTDGSGEGISASNLQSISNCIEGLVQGTDKAVHSISFSGSAMTLVYADGTEETFNTSVKGISSISKTGTSGNVDTYTILYTDGTSTSFNVTNGTQGETGPQGPEGPEGPQGPSGADGEDGVSPDVEITTITGGHTVTITDADHPSGQSFNVMDGDDGQDGQDGVSPTIAIATITGGHSVTITDADHPSGQTFNVMDGSGSGDMQSSAYDPNGTVATAGGIPSYVSGQISGKADDSDLDDWTSTTTVSSGTFTFSGLDDTHGWGYKPFVDVDGNSTQKNPTSQISSISGAGTSNMTVNYTTDADNGATVKLRIIK